MVATGSRPLRILAPVSMVYMIGKGCKHTLQMIFVCTGVLQSFGCLLVLMERAAD